MEKLVSSYNPMAASSVMCRNTISISWDGYIFDCDFNQMLKIHMGNGTIKNVRDLNKIPEGQKIAIADHCYGCTAGNGSSCGGNLI